MKKRFSFLLLGSLLAFSAAHAADKLPGRTSGKMVIRSAVMEGSVPEAIRADFDHRMYDVLALLSRYPGIKDARIRFPSKGVEHEKGAPDVYVAFDMYFDSVSAMNAALASPVREEVRSEIAKAVKGFQGKLYHFVLDETGGIAQ